MHLSHVKRLATSCWAALAILARMPGLVAMARIAAPRAAGERTGTSTPVMPGMMASALPPTCVAMAGTPAAMASSRALELPSS